MSDERPSPPEGSGRPTGAASTDGGSTGGPPTGAVPAVLGALAEHWGLAMAYGLISVGLGLTLAVWPGETVTVVAVLIGVQFLVSGLIRIIGAVAARAVDMSLRMLLGVTGAIALLVGLLCLRDPLQTLLAITLLLGAWWLISGVIDIVGAVVSPTPGRRGWDILSGAVSVLAGGFLLADPELSLGVLVFLTCAWLIATGAVAVAIALRLRSLQRQERIGAATTGPPPAPAV